MLGAGALFSVSMTAFRYTSGIRGSASGELDDEEIERREAMKKMRRRPLSETIEQLGEGRGEHDPALLTMSLTDSLRYLRSRVRGEEATEADGQIRNRCEGSAGLDAIRNFLGVHNRSRYRNLKIEHFTTFVHTTCCDKVENDKRSSSSEDESHVEQQQQFLKDAFQLRLSLTARKNP